MFKERTRRKVFLWAMLCCQPPLSLPLSSLSNMPSRARLDAYLVNNIPLSRPPFPTTESPFDNLSTAESNSDADNTSDKAVQYFSSDSFQGSFIATSSRFLIGAHLIPNKQYNRTNARLPARPPKKAVVSNTRPEAVDFVIPHVASHLFF